MSKASPSGAALIIFIKNPEKGKVKTRLAETLGQETALKIYLALLRYTRNIAMALPVNRLLFYSRFIEEGDDWPPTHFQKYLQTGSHLGARICNAFHQALQHYQKVVIIGSDCANLRPAIVEEAFKKLDEYAYVVGPATDGGYYLLGMKSPTPTLFQGIAWSTEEVLPATLQKIEELGQSCHLLPELSDIDRAEDWEKYGWNLD